MRILVAIDHWGLIGGSERYAAAITSALVERGHHVSALAGGASGAPLAEVECTIVPALSDARAEVREVARAARSARPDVLFVLGARKSRAFEALLEVAPLVRFVQDHTLFCPGQNKQHADGAPCTSALGVACLSRYVLAGGCHGFRRELHTSPFDALGGLRKHLRGIELARRASSLIVASHYMRGELVRAGLDAARVEVIPYFTRSAPLTSPPDAPAQIFTAARLVLPDKGVDYLLTALGKTRHRVRALVAGSGPAEEWLKQKAREEGLERRVEFAGWLDAEATERAYAASAVVVFPSMWNEPFGLVGLEAMAHARPVIAFDVGGVHEWLEHDVTGLLVKRGDTDALAAAIDALLDDPERARALGRAGRARLERDFGRDRHVTAIERALARAASR